VERNQLAHRPPARLRPAPTPNTTACWTSKTRASPKVTFDLNENIAAPFIATGVRPRVAILREQGVNSHIETAYVMHQAGFTAVDVHMSDLIAGRVKLDDFQGVIAVGGFSYGDVLGAGEGWAKTILFNASWPSSSRASSTARTPSAWASATAAR
jgi:hypothetical protein